MFENYQKSSLQPWIIAKKFMVSSGQYLATGAGFRILNEGGNAIDAGVATGFCLNTVHCDMNTMSGVAPIIIYLANQQEVISLAGVGTWPQDIDAGMFKGEKSGLVRKWPLQSIVPAAFDAWITALRDYGTMRFAEVVEPALEFAEEGFPVHSFMQITIKHFLENYRSWSPNRDIFLDQGNPPSLGKVIRLAGLARTFRHLIDVEKAASSLGREGALNKVRDYFYKGDIANDLVKMNQESGGLIKFKDFLQYQVKKEPVCKINFRGIDVYSCGPWSQGPVLLEALNILKEFDLKTMGHNSEHYVHYLTEALKLSFSDREAYYGDPEFVDVPMSEMLNPEYGRTRGRLIRADKAFPTMPPCGEFSTGCGWAPGPEDASQIPSGGDRWGKEVENYSKGPADTSYVAVIDGEGNMFSATPSDGYCNAPIHPYWGLHISERGGQTNLSPNHPNYLQAGKRPRLTPCPALALKDGKPFMAFGTPGNDRQPQALLQFFLNLNVFKMPPQEAVTQPRLASFSFPATTYPNTYFPGLLRLEGNISEETISGCNKKGHRIQLWPELNWVAGGVCAVVRDPESGVFWGAADPRREGSVLGL